jgi:hypothetical protein
MHCWYFRKVMDEPKPSESDLGEDRSKVNIEPENIYVGADGTEEVATRVNGKRFRVSLCVHQNLTQLLDATFPGRKSL